MKTESKTPAGVLAAVHDTASAIAADVMLAPLVGGQPDFSADREAFEWAPDALETIPDEDLPRLCYRIDCFDYWTDRVSPDATVVRTLGPDPRHFIRRGDPHELAAAVEILDRALKGGPLVDPGYAKPTRKRRPLSLPVAANDNAPGERDKARFALTWFDDIKEATPKEHVIAGAFGVGEFTTVYGAPGCGKSVVLTDAACHVAAGLEWHGRCVKPGMVVYIAAERKALTERRMLAFRKRHDVKDVPLLVVGGRLDFTRDLADARVLSAVIKKAALAAEHPCVWIIIDTLTRTFGAGDQNTSKDMGRFIQSCDLLLEQTGAHITAIHHTGWDGERGKGAIDLDGAVDASFLVKKAGGEHTLTCDGANDGDEGRVLAFRLESVEVGRSDDGEPTTAPVVVATEGGLAAALVSSAKGYAAEALDALRADILTGGTNIGDGPAVTVESWRAKFYEQYQGVLPDTLKKRFDRAKRSLESSGEVVASGIWFRPRGA
jgi:hypothetical protein